MGDIVGPGRDPATGRWLKGQSGNVHGRRPAKWRSEVQEHYFDLARSAVTDQDWLDIVRAAVADARDNHSSTARKWLSSFLLPSERTLEILALERSEQTVTIKVVYGDGKEKAGQVIDGEQWEVVNSER